MTWAAVAWRSDFSRALVDIIASLEFIDNLFNFAF